MEESEFDDEMRTKVIASFCSVLYVWSISVASSINGLFFWFIQFWRAFILKGNNVFIQVFSFLIPLMCHSELKQKGTNSILSRSK